MSSVRLSAPGLAPVKVLFVIDEYRNPYAGTERQLYELISGLDLTRFTPELAVLRNSPYLESGDFPCPTRVWNITKIGSVSTLLEMNRLARACWREGFRIVHAFFNDAGVLIPFFFKRVGFRVYTSRRDMGFWYTRANLALLRMAAARTDGVIANSSAVAANVCEKERVEPRQVHVIYNGVAQNDEGLSLRVPEPIAALRGRPIVGMVANIRPIKRIDDLLRAFALVAEEVQDASLVVVGGGDSAALSALAHDLGISRRLTFTGQVSNPKPIVSLFDVAVLCSESEGLSNSIIEYMLCGKPVVATDTGGNPELVEAGVTGWLVPVGDITALAEKVLSLLHDRRLASKFGQEGLRRAHTRFSIDGMVRAHEKLYSNGVAC